MSWRDRLSGVEELFSSVETNNDAALEEAGC